MDGYTPSQIEPSYYQKIPKRFTSWAVIEAKKSGRSSNRLQDEEFEFILKDNDGKEVQKNQE